MTNQNLTETIKILIVCDESSKTDCIGNFLRSNGFNILPNAGVFEVAVKVIDFDLPDVIIININPSNSKDVGLLTAEYILQHYHIPVVFLCQDVHDEYLRHYRQNHPVSILSNTASNYKEHLLGAVNFSIPDSINPLNKFKLKEFKVVELDLDINGKIKPDSYKNHIHFKKWIALKDIAYLEASNHTQKNTSLIWLNNLQVHCYLVRGTLDHFIEMLPQHYFLRIHNSYIVNTTLVDGIKLPHDIFINHFHLPIGISYLNMVKNEFDKLLFR